MNTIHKITFDKLGLNKCELPFDARIISCHAQFEYISVWYITNPEVINTEYRYFYVFNTGVHFEDSIKRLNFLGTVMFDNIVHHVFEGTL